MNLIATLCSRILLLTFLVSLLSGCRSLAPASAYPFIEGWKAEAVDSDGSTPAPWPAEDGYALWLMTKTVGVHLSDGAVRFRNPGPKQNAGKKSRVGHSWLILESPDERIECGHTASRGKLSPRYDRAIGRLIKQGHPNPVSYLERSLPCGRRHGHVAFLTPSFALRIPLTRARYESVRNYIDAYDFSTFSVANHQCTGFVAGAAAAAGLKVASAFRLHVPSTALLKGEERILWTDPQYATILLPSPDVLETSLRRLAAAGFGEDVTERF